MFVYGSHAVNGVDAGTGADRIGDFKVGTDFLRLIDGVSVAGSRQGHFGSVSGNTIVTASDGVLDTEFTLSNGSTIQLIGVNGFNSDWDGLFIA